MQSAQQSLEPGSRNRTHLPPGLPAVPEKNERGNAANTVTKRSVGVQVGVELEHEEVPRAFAGQVIKQGRHDFAGLTPVSVKVNEHRHIAVGDDAVKGSVGDCDWPVEQERPAALSALRPVPYAVHAHAVQLTTERTGDRRLFWISLRFHHQVSDGDLTSAAPAPSIDVPS